ncbi:MAG: FAD:protein FMN transferase [Bacillota bacterium]|jgi:thiamine biosynthesis lipoprotein
MGNKKLKTVLFVGLPLIILATLGYWAAANRRRTLTKTEFCLGTMVEITATGKAPEKAVRAAFDAIRHIESLASSHLGSDINRINQAAGIKAVKTAPETIAILKLIQDYQPLISGAFDPTVAPLVDLWGFGYEAEPRLPKPDQIQRLLPLVDWKQVRINPAAGTVFLAKPEMKLDLGGVAKGYAIDQAYQSLRRAGIASALINGGNSSIRVIGARHDRKPWQIGIGHPRRTEELLGQLTLPHDSALGTSADTQNYFIHSGQRYSHLLNPRTGYPSRDKILVALTAPTAAEADLLSTACFILPLAKIRQLIAKRPGLKIIIVDQKQRVRNLNNPNFHPITEAEN